MRRFGSSAAETGARDGKAVTRKDSRLPVLRDKGRMRDSAGPCPLPSAVGIWPPRSPTCSGLRDSSSSPDGKERQTDARRTETRKEPVPLSRWSVLTKASTTQFQGLSGARRVPVLGLLRLPWMSPVLRTLTPAVSVASSSVRTRNSDFKGTKDLKGQLSKEDTNGHKLTERHSASSVTRETRTETTARLGFTPADLQSSARRARAGGGGRAAALTPRLGTCSPVRGTVRKFSQR